MTSQTAVTPRSMTATTGKVRVLIVDDSVVIRHLLRAALEADPQIEVVGCESNGVAALAAIPRLKPDLVTLDIEMPEMDGLETLRHLRTSHPMLRVIMFSTLTQRGAYSTFEALSLGADDYVAKAANGSKLDESMASLRAELLPKVRQFFSLSAPQAAQPQPVAPARVASSARPLPVGKASIVGIGVSTGGPNALAELLPRLPGDFPLPIVIVQHMPPTFTRLLAERLNAASPLEVVQAEDGMEVMPGRVIVARGDYHLRAKSSGTKVVAALDQGPPENSCRPAVDVLFRSLRDVYGSSVVSVVLTGMGFDGMRGAEALKAAGGFTIVQDKATSVVWGMPGAVAQAGLADRILPLGAIGDELVRIAKR